MERVNWLLRLLVANSTAAGDGAFFVEVGLGEGPCCWSRSQGLLLFPPNNSDSGELVPEADFWRFRLWVDIGRVVVGEGTSVVLQRMVLLLFPPTGSGDPLTVGIAFMRFLERFPGEEATTVALQQGLAGCFLFRPTMPQLLWGLLAGASELVCRWT